MKRLLMVILILLSSMVVSGGIPALANNDINFPAIARTLASANITGDLKVLGNIIVGSYFTPFTTGVISERYLMINAGDVQEGTASLHLNGSVSDHTGFGSINYYNNGQIAIQLLGTEDGSFRLETLPTEGSFTVPGIKVARGIGSGWQAGQVYTYNSLGVYDCLLSSYGGESINIGNTPGAAVITTESYHGPAVLEQSRVGDIGSGSTVGRYSIFAGNSLKTQKEVARIHTYIVGNDENSAAMVLSVKKSDGTWVNALRLHPVNGDSLGPKLMVGETSVAPAPDTTLHVWKGSAGAVNGSGEAVIESDHNTKLEILTPPDKTGALSFSRPGGADRGMLAYSHSQNTLVFRANGVEQAYIGDGSFRLPRLPASDPHQYGALYTDNSTGRMQVFVSGG